MYTVTNWRRARGGYSYTIIGPPGTVPLQCWRRGTKQEAQAVAEKTLARLNAPFSKIGKKWRKHL